MNEAYLYELQQTAKDRLFAIVTFMKYRWGYDTWDDICYNIAISRYDVVKEIISRQRNSRNKRDALELCETIMDLDLRLELAARSHSGIWRG